MTGTTETRRVIFVMPRTPQCHTHVQSTRAAPMKTPTEATKVPRRPSKAKGARPAAALLVVGELVEVPVPLVLDVFDDDEVPCVELGVVGVVE